MNWMELREEEFEEAVQRSGGLCVVPVGCFEMHGEHLPVGTDVYEAVAVAEKAAEMEDVVIFPAFEFGDVAGLVEWRGGVNLDSVWYLDFPSGGFCGTAPVGATERIGKLMLRLSAEKAVKAIRAFKENADVLKQHRDKKNSFYSN